MKLIKRILIGIVAIVVVAYVGVVGYLYFFQESFVYEPSGTLETPTEKGLPSVEVIELTMADGTPLTGWYKTAEAGEPVLLYFQGNSGNISGRADRFRQVLDSGFGLLAMSYRGYPGSGGKPSEKAIFSDALEIFDWLEERTDDIVIHGESLGTGIATYTASQRPEEALILEAPYTAVVDIAAERHPWVPVRLLMHDQYKTYDYIDETDTPLLIVHGTADTTIPVRYGEELFEMALDPKELFIIDGATHGNLWENGLWPAALNFLQENGVIDQPEP
jgi:fermentation-respiration switch protein FrsA (DUF1100 family)